MSSPSPATAGPTVLRRPSSLPPTARQNDYFGNSVAIDGNTIVVGAETANAAYVFDIVAWHDIAEKGDTSHIVRRLTNDIEHTFLVRAVNANGTGPPSDSKAATPVEAAYAPARPRNFSATQTGIGEVELTWDAHRYPLTVTGYEYNQDAGGGSSWTDIDGSDSSTVSHTVTGLTKGTTYTFAVRAANSSSAGSTESDSQSVDYRRRTGGPRLIRRRSGRHPSAARLGKPRRFDHIRVRVPAGGRRLETNP